MDLQDVVVVNGTTLYYERTGTGPSVLFIAGTTGDAGHFAQGAARLADEFTVVTYDRRGNSRSPRPVGWTQTSVPEQAEDAAALIQALQLAPMTVFAASAGGPIGLDLMIRFPHGLRGKPYRHGIVTPSVPLGQRLRTSEICTAMPALWAPTG